MVKTLIQISFLLLLATSVMAEEGGKKEGKNSQKELTFEDIIVPVLMREDVQGYYSLSITITPKEEDKKEELRQFGPRIKDAIIHDLFVVLPVIWSSEQKPSVDVIKKRIEMVAKKTTPDNTVGEVIINAFQISEAKEKKPGEGE